MKRISLLAIAVVSALTITAAIGSASASATVLCKTRVEGFQSCPSGSVLPAGSYYSHASWEGEKEVFNIVGGTLPFHCDRVGIGGETTATIGSPGLPIKGGGIIGQCYQGFSISKGTPCQGTFGSTKDTLEAYGGPSILYIGSASEPLVVSFKCETSSKESYTCTFRSGSKPPAMWVGWSAEKGGTGSIEGAAMSVTAGNSAWCPVGAESKMSMFGHNVYENYPAVS